MDAPPGQSGSYESVRCTCGYTLWRAYPDCIQISLGVRAGKRFEIEIPVCELPSARQVKVRCVACSGIWLIADALRADPVINGAAALVAGRPPAELTSIVGHNAERHRGEAA